MKGRKLLMIPGPVEFTPEVLRAMGMPTTSHVAPAFVEVFGQVLERMRRVFLCPSGQLITHRTRNRSCLLGSFRTRPAQIHAFWQEDYRTLLIFCFFNE